MNWPALAEIAQPFFDQSGFFFSVIAMLAVGRNVQRAAIDREIFRSGAAWVTLLFTLFNQLSLFLVIGCVTQS